MTPYATQLRQVPGLAMCSRSDLERLARVAERVQVAAGSVVTGSTDRWTGTCIVERGQAVICLAGWTIVLPPGSRVVREDANAGDLDVVARTDVDAIVVGRGYQSISALPL